MSEHKTEAERLKEQLLMKNDNGYLRLDDSELERAQAFCEGYKAFLDAGKTEREVVATTVAMLREHGFEPFDPQKQYAPGARVYQINRGKALIFATVGTRPIAEGVRILASHIDSPRLDMKPNPLFEESELGYLKTHYYGGIKKYQWVAMPLALHGVVVKKDGTTVQIRIGEEPGDPVFCLTDLLPHLDKEQAKRTLLEGIKGEEMNLLIGSRPFKDDKASERVKLRLMQLLNERYGIDEYDFHSA